MTRESSRDQATTSSLVLNKRPRSGVLFSERGKVTQGGNDCRRSVGLRKRGAGAPWETVGSETCPTGVRVPDSVLNCIKKTEDPAHWVPVSSCARRYKNSPSEREAVGIEAPRSVESLLPLVS